MEKEKNRPEKRKAFRYLLTFVFIFLFISGASLISVLNNDVIAMGRAGFIRNASWRIGLGILAAVIGVSCIGAIFKYRKSVKGTLGRIFGAVICLLLALFLIRAVILDIPYLDQPEITYLYRLEFDDDHTGDGPPRYYLRGTGIDGSTHSFSVNEDEYEEGRKLWFENFELRAKITYLPHMDVVISLQYLRNLDEQSKELFPPSADLPDDWESFAIQINDVVYSLPTPLASFLDNGWTIAEGDAKLRLSGADEPYARYDDQQITLTSAQEQRIKVTVYNTTEQTIDIAQSTVGDIYVIYGNYDFTGTNLRLPGGLMLGWSSRKDVLKQYGEPNESFEKYSVTYQKSDSATAYWNLYFDDSGYLDEVMIHNQAYYRDN